MNNFKMYFHITRFCSTSCHLLPLCSKFVLNNLFLNTSSLCPSFDVRDVFDFRRLIKCSQMHVPASLRWISETASLSFTTFVNLRSVNFLVHEAAYSGRCLPTKLCPRISNFSFPIYATGELKYFSFAQSQSGRSETNFPDNSRPQENKLCTQYTD